MRRVRCLKTLFAILALMTVMVGQGQDLDGLATEFLNSLSEPLREQAHFAMEDGERTRFHFTPQSRKGPTFHDFDETQKAKALALLSACLSQQGYAKAREIMQLEVVLAELADSNPIRYDGYPYRDPLNYHFLIFGNPSDEDFWGWRFEGHHISLSFTADDGKIMSSTPTFLGSNPGKVLSTKAKGTEVLSRETALGFELVNMLSESQLQKALIAEEAPYEIYTEAKSEVSSLEPKGIGYGELTDPQQKLLLDLLNLYLDNYEQDFSDDFRKKIEAAGIANLTFAWAGSLKAGAGHYYRIQNPVFLIEYDNTQNNANHVHTVVRDLENDFGRDVLREHYEADHK